MRTEDTDTLDDAIKNLEEVKKDLKELQRLVEEIASMMGYDEYKEAEKVIDDDNLPF